MRSSLWCLKSDTATYSQISSPPCSLLRELNSELEKCGGCQKEVWSDALREAGIGEVALVRFLTAPGETVVEAVARTFALIRGLGRAERSVVLPGPQGVLRLQLDELGTAGVDAGGLLWDSARLMGLRLWAQDGPYGRFNWPSTRVLEVGCGACGVPGITAAHLGAETVVLSDFKPELTNSAYANWLRSVPDQALDSSNSRFHSRRNSFDSSVSMQSAASSSVGTLSNSGSSSDYMSDASFRGQSRKVEKNDGVAAVHKALLDWSDLPTSISAAPALLQADSFDVVLASDVIYDTPHAVPCAQALHRFVRKDAPHARVFVVLGDEKARAGFPLFFSEMDRLGFEVEFADRTTELTELVFRLR